ncbi:AlbA family DNA-binding domain-containing protein [Actinoalloteichus hymeniacidonis]|uniref:AlbA family DNA-binding domain-containing protein n=1 Tax=Actinoalloteichus hymeniacidonis TaxID=340345 RepID=UPI001560B445
MFRSAISAPSALIGLCESQYLDAKSSGYNLRIDSQKLELASDVAAFANATDGGVILIGAETAKDKFGRDQIVKFPGIASRSVDVNQYRDTISRYAIPGISGLRIDVCETEGSELLCILIPPQNPSKIPFIVKGSINKNGKISGKHIAVPIRSTDGNTHLDAHLIHAALSDGWHKKK